MNDKITCNNCPFTDSSGDDWKCCLDNTIIDEYIYMDLHNPECQLNEEVQNNGNN